MSNSLKDPYNIHPPVKELLTEKESSTANQYAKLTKEQAYLAAIATDFTVFIRQAFHTVYSTTPFLDNWHIKAMVYHLEQCLQGHLPRLIINLPPRHLKSFLTSVALPAFILSQDPSAKIICVSYADELTKKLTLDFRRIVESEWYRKIFPKVRIQKNTGNEFATTAGGFRFATSVHGTITGRGGDIIIIDDPIKPTDAVSDKMRNSTNDWFRNTLLSRLDDKQYSVLILLMQRLHVNDLTGYIEHKGGFHKLAFPAIAIRDERIPIGNNEHHLRLAGTALHEEREGLKILGQIRDQVSEFTFSAQYQQQPMVPEGGLIKQKWLNFPQTAPEITDRGYLIVSIDAAASTSETADYSAISLVYAIDGQHYVLSAKRGRWDYETLQKMALAYTRKYGNHIYFLVEAASAGISLIQFLQNNRFNCFSYKPKSDKQTRAAKIVHILESGRVHIINNPEDNDWVRTYVDELLSFPNGQFDDQVDSLVQAIAWAEPKINPQGRIYLC